MKNQNKKLGLAASKINIGFIIPNFELYGGPKRVVMLANLLSDRGYSVRLYVLSKLAKLPKWVKNKNFFIYEYRDLFNPDFDSSGPVFDIRQSEKV
jgi:hypothetical protein